MSWLTFPGAQSIQSTPPRVPRNTSGSRGTPRNQSLGVLCWTIKFQMTCGTKITENIILLNQKPVHRYFDFSDPLLRTKPLKTCFSKQNNSMKKICKKAYKIMKIEKINFKCF